MNQRRLFSPHFTSLLQLTATLLIVVYMLFIGGSFNATVNYRVQLLNAVGASLIAVVWLIGHLRQRSAIAQTGLELPLTLFVLSQWIAALTSAQPRLSLEQAATTTAWAIVFIVICDLLAHGWPQRFFENALLLTASLITLQALLEIGIWLKGWFQLGLLPLVAYRVTGFLGHPNLTAASLNLILPFIIFKIIRAPSHPTRIAFIALLLGVFIVEFFTSSRSGWIGAVALLVTLFGLLILGKTAQTRLQSLFPKINGLPFGLRLTLVTVTLILTAITGYALWLQTRHPSHPEFFSSRQYIWGPAWEVFLAHPLTGGGPGLYTWFYPHFTSIPPEWLAPHAHSLFFQTLSDTGLIGLLTGMALLAVAAYQLGQRWRTATDKLWSAALIVSGVGWFVHHIFDYLFGTPAFLFIFILIAALALRPAHSTQNQARHYSPLYLGLPLLGLFGFAIFSLRAAALNDQGMQLVSENKWHQAATVFEQAAQSDPGLTLYWQNAAYAYTRAGDTQSALPLWQKVIQDDPHWVIAPATLALLQNDPTTMQAALALAPRSDLLALNTGALNELNGDPIAAQSNYTLALKLNPATAQALFWQQTDLRKEVLLKWQLTHPAPPTSPEATIQLFQQAITDSPLNNAAYISLARAYWLTGDETQAQRYRAIAQLIPVTAPEQTLQLYLFDGDWAEAHGDQAGAIHAYTLAFSIINDYTYGGPGTYGYPQRYWNVYHRPAPPSDLIPQFNRGVITPELETRFAKLARWLTQQGDTETACFILARIFWEAPQSTSGQSWKVNCSPAR